MEQYRLIHRSLAEAKEPVTSINNHATDVAFQLAVSTGKPIRGTNNANGRYAVQVGGLMGESVISDLVRSALAQGVEAQDGVVDSKDATGNSADEPENLREGPFGDARDEDTKRSSTSADEVEQFHLDSRAAPGRCADADWSHERLHSTRRHGVTKLPSKYWRAHIYRSISYKPCCRLLPGGRDRETHEPGAPGCLETQFRHHRTKQE